MVPHIWFVEEFMRTTVRSKRRAGILIGQADLAGVAKKRRVAAEAFFEAGQVLKRERRFEQSELVELFQKSVKSDPKFAPPHRDLCTLFAQDQPRVAKTH